MKNKRIIPVVFLVVFSIFALSIYQTQAAMITSHSWTQFFSFDQIKAIRKAVTKSIRQKFVNRDDDWKGIVSGDALKEETLTNIHISPNAAISYSKLRLAGSIRPSDLSSGGCSSGQVLKFNGSAWACADEGGSDVLGSAIESSEITDGTIVNSDISSSAAIGYSKLSLAGSVLSSDFASNGCSSGQVLEFDGSQWACANNSGSSFLNLSDDLNITFASSSNKLLVGSSTEGVSIYSDRLKATDTYLSTQGVVELGGDCPYAGVGYCGGFASEGPYIKFSSTANDENVIMAMDRDANGDLHIGKSDGDSTFNVEIFGSLRLYPSATDPVTCDNSTEGRVYYNSTAHNLKICDGTSWKSATLN